MTTPTPLPLDTAALDEIGARPDEVVTMQAPLSRPGYVPIDAGERDALIAQSRAALTLAARVAELEAENAKLREGGVAGAMAYADARVQAGENAAHANALRDALEKVREFLIAEYGLSASEAANTGGVVALEAYHAWESVNAALAATPAASLAAHDAEVLERLAAVEHEQWMQWAISLMDTEPRLSHARVSRWRSLLVPYAELSEEMKEHDRKWAHRALAAQAQEVKPHA